MDIYSKGKDKGKGLGFELRENKGKGPAALCIVFYLFSQRASLGYLDGLIVRLTGT